MSTYSDIPSTKDAKEIPHKQSENSYTTQGTLIVQEARKHVGKAYSRAKRLGPNSFDCSGLVGYVYKTAIGYNSLYGLTSVNIYHACKNKLVDKNNPKPGDILFFIKKDGCGRSPEIHHVGIATGNGLEMIEARNPSKGVIVGSASGWGGQWEYYAAARLISDTEAQYEPEPVDPSTCPGSTYQSDICKTGTCGYNTCESSNCDAGREVLVDSNRADIYKEKRARFSYRRDQACWEMSIGESSLNMDEDTASFGTGENSALKVTKGAVVVQSSDEEEGTSLLLAEEANLSNGSSIVNLQKDKGQLSFKKNVIKVSEENISLDLDGKANISLGESGTILLQSGGTTIRITENGAILEGNLKIQGSLTVNGSVWANHYGNLVDVSE